MTFFILLITISIVETYILYTLSQIDSFTPYNIINKLDYSNIIIVVFLITNVTINILSIFITEYLVQREKFREKKNPEYIPLTDIIKKRALYIDIIATLIICTIWIVLISA